MRGSLFCGGASAFDAADSAVDKVTQYIMLFVLKGVEMSARVLLIPTWRACCEQMG